MYRSNMIPVLLRVLSKKFVEPSTGTTKMSSNTFSLLHIDLSKVEDNFEESALQLVHDFEKIGKIKSTSILFSSHINPIQK